MADPKRGQRVAWIDYVSYTRFVKILGWMVEA